MSKQFSGVAPGWAESGRAAPPSPDALFERFSGRMLGRVPALLVDLLVLVVLWVPGMSPLAAEGFILGHDFEDPPWRSLEIARALAEGTPYPRWSAEVFAGFGAPIFNFYAPLSYYPAALLSLIAPVGLLDASKITFALSLLASGIGAYLLARQLLRHRGGALLAGVLYMYSTGVIGDLYVRTNVAGSVSLAVIPFVMFCFARLLDRPTPFNSGVTALLLAALIFTHNINSAIGLGMAAVLVGFHYLFGRDLKSLPLVLLAVSLGLGLASFFWLPSVAEMGLTRDARYDVVGHLVDPLGGDQGQFGPESYDQTPWGPFDLHTAYPYGLPPYKFGLVQGALMAITGLVLLFRVVLLRRKPPAGVLALYLTTLILFYFHTTWARWLYDLVAASNLIQFPWRLLRPAGLPLAVAGAWAILQAPAWARRALIPSLAVAAVYSGMALAPTKLEPFPFGPITPEGLVQWQAKAEYRLGTQLQGQFLPLSVQWENQSNAGMLTRYAQSFPPADWAADTAAVPRTAKAWVVAARRTQDWMQAVVEAEETTTVAFHTIYFAGWIAYLDGKRVSITPSPRTEYEHQRYATLGVCLVQAPEGRHVVTLVFEDTPVRTLGDALARLSLMAVLALLLAPGWWTGERWSRRRLLAALALACLLVIGAGLLLAGIKSSARAKAWAIHDVVFDLAVEEEAHRLRLSIPEGRQTVEFLHLKKFVVG